MPALDLSMKRESGQHPDMESGTVTPRFGVRAVLRPKRTALAVSRAHVLLWHTHSVPGA